MTELQAARSAARRLAVLRHAEEITGNVAQTCRYYGISRQLFYVWKRRFEAEGLDGLRDRSRRPHNSPRATRAEVVGKILYLRQNYHLDRGISHSYIKARTPRLRQASGVGGLLQLPPTARRPRRADAL